MGSQLADPDTDWETHMLQLKAIDSPKGVTRLAKQKFAASIQMFDSDPTDPVLWDARQLVIRGQTASNGAGLHGRQATSTAQ